MAVSGLRKSYWDVEAVRSVTFEVRGGEIFALLGPNGAVLAVWGALGAVFAARRFRWEPHTAIA